MRPIDADRLLQEKRMHTYYHLPNGDIAIPLIDIKNAQPVDPNRRVGEWIEMGQNEDGTHNVKCDQCDSAYKMRGHAKSINTKLKYRFCPHCGARMR